MEFLGIHHVAIIASDYAKSKEFYTRTLGLEVIAEEYRPERRSYKLDLAIPGGSRIELFSFPVTPPRRTRPEAAGLRHLAFAVQDVAATLDTLAARGVRTEELRVDAFTGKRMAFFFDPDDLPLELYEM
ncbi:VOC family protein [Nocardia sp. NPDC050710]|uniref:SMU1112c/YaeR family gloxylase I-like metalloprotein n=1 Tax=Nocardia sp. NPDC050710 TaxID=3157220 RepID=UPI0033EE580F